MRNYNNIIDDITASVEKQMEEITRNTQNPIFVFLGVEQYVKMDAFNEYLVDQDTFLKNGNRELFNQVWFSQVFTQLNLVATDTDKPYCILSFPQFSYLINYIQPDFFKDRIVIVKDGFRSLLPLPKEDYIEKSEQENIEERSDTMPVYMAEQLQIGNSFFYSIQMPLDHFMTLDIFTQEEPLRLLKNDEENEVIDTVSDPHGIDIFINRCLAEKNFSKIAVVKIFKKQPMNAQSVTMLQKMNWLLTQFGGQLYELDEKEIIEVFQPSEETLQLLQTHWGQNASFRQLSVYKKPDYGKEIISISQGQIVETIIEECKNARSNKDVRDLFLTAPTGAGKSLLFQLPAFYVSSQNDVTIVVSPLIALMRDQVEQIRQERGFHKACFINSDLSLIERENVINDCKNGEMDILYLAPELLLSYDITYFIGDRHLGLLVVDEAHLITTWGRDFRVDYWFLGQHINKIRKNADYKFPVVAVTATAIYGGDNDMVFDSVNSLYMHDPHLFIGEVKRKNITFVIDNHEKFKSNYDTEKEMETVKFIEDAAAENLKTIVYAPYRRHIDNIAAKLIADKKGDIAVAYHSGLPDDLRTRAYDLFKNNSAIVMVSTKAFGMGVDIPDIQIVYHHAPSGLLPDYVQEVGRAARIPSLNGFAALSYALEDQRYSKTLHGMSALRHYQIKEMLNKINRTFLSNNGKRNMLVSAEDFSYIFDNNYEYDQKVMTALMMIEKDYLAKYRFNVLIARPKKLFVKVYAKVNTYGMRIIERKHAGCFSRLFDMNDGVTYVELDLDKIWKRHFSDQSFPMLKHAFYEGKLLEDDHAECKPQVKTVFTFEKDADQINTALTTVLDALQGALTRLSNKYFTSDEFENALCDKITNTTSRKKIVSFLLATYSSQNYGLREVDVNAFLQRRRYNGVDKYIVFNNKFTNCFAMLKRRMQKLSQNKTGNTASTFSSYGSDNLTTYIRLGSLLEILGLGSYECRGGDKPMVFIRINDPRRIAHDAADKSYRNSLLTNIEKRYKSSTEIFDHFFLHSFSNDERWDFIEDFFLGESNDELFLRYPGGERNHVDIITYLHSHKNQLDTNDLAQNHNQQSFSTFPPRQGGYYEGRNLITIDGVTRSVDKWILEDPVELDKTRRKFELALAKEAYQLLSSKIKSKYFPYYRDVMGLSLLIDFPGYPEPVMAKIPYSDNPVKFYKWWKKNEDKVTITFKEKIDLFIRVAELDDRILLKIHRQIINK